MGMGMYGISMVGCSVTIAGTWTNPPPGIQWAKLPPELSRLGACWSGEGGGEGWGGRNRYVAGAEILRPPACIIRDVISNPALVEEVVSRRESRDWEMQLVEDVSDVSRMMSGPPRHDVQ